MISIARTYGLLCRETDFVAVEERAEGAKTLGEVLVRKVPSLITAGWHGGVFMDTGIRACLSVNESIPRPMFLPD